MADPKHKAFLEALETAEERGEEALAEACAEQAPEALGIREALNLVRDAKTAAGWSGEE